MNDLDQRIRSLVTAIAEASPEPPVLPARNRKPLTIWWRGPRLAGLAFAVAVAVFVGLSGVFSTPRVEPIATVTVPVAEPLGSRRHQVLELTVVADLDCFETGQQSLVLGLETWADFEAGRFRQTTTFPSGSTSDVIAFGDLDQPSETYRREPQTDRWADIAALLICPGDAFPRPDPGFASIVFLDPTRTGPIEAELGDPIEGEHVDSLDRPARLYRPDPFPPGTTLEFYFDVATGALLQTVQSSIVANGTITRTTVLVQDENASLNDDVFDITDFERVDPGGPIVVAAGEPSQSPGDAARDGVLPDIAALPYAERVGELLRVESDEGVWVLSRMPITGTVRQFGRCDIQGRDCIYGIDMATENDYSELLLLDEVGGIVKAYPMAGMPPSWLYLDDDFLYGGMIGDGGLPDSTVFRVHRESRSLTGVYLITETGELQNEGWYPWTINSGLLPGWTLDVSKPVFLSVGSNDIGAVKVESWMGDVYVDLDKVRELLVFPEDF